MSKNRLKPRIGTPLYEKCQACEQSDERPHICENGFIETGYTTERYDKMQTEIDRLLILLERAQMVMESGEVNLENLMIRTDVQKLLAARTEELEAAKSRLPSTGIIGRPPAPDRRER